jgi:hypothetical protein
MPRQRALLLLRRFATDVNALERKGALCRPVSHSLQNKELLTLDKACTLKVTLPNVRLKRVCKS